ncbi:MAG TPA: glutamate--cysteine ligase, partial [Marmoricola sp.]|nr:glutamate--cysteine ligase [Marmoricola sp.]
PGIGHIPATELTLRKLLPMAREGLADWGVSAAEIDRYLGVIEERCKAGQNGASWFVRKVQGREAAGEDRRSALRLTLQEYRENMHSNSPVHSWG